MASTIIAACGGAFIAGIFSLITWALNNKKQRETGIQAGVRMLLYFRIKTAAQKYIKVGSITYDIYEDLVGMHKIYKDMGGDGFLDELMAAIHALPKK